MFLKTKRLKAKLDGAAAYYNKLIIFTNSQALNIFFNLIIIISSLCFLKIESCNKRKLFEFSIKKFTFFMLIYKLFQFCLRYFFRFLTLLKEKAQSKLHSRDCTYLCSFKQKKKRTEIVYLCQEQKRTGKFNMILIQSFRELKQQYST